MRSGTSQINNKKFWVPARWIIKATGWTKEDMRQARENSIITWRHTDENGFEYDLQSIPEVYKINTNAKKTPPVRLRDYAKSNQ